MAHLLSVNVGVPRDSGVDGVGVTGIDKRPVDGPVEVRSPGPVGSGGSGAVGDSVVDRRHHGGYDQALYAYAREDLDAWAAELGRELRSGTFGENLTTSGLDVSGARIGERWRIGKDVIVEVSAPRIPCRTFAWMLAEQGWIKRFTERAVPGTYLRVIEAGPVRAADPIEVVFVPDHDVTVALTFRALTLEPELLPALLAAEALPEEAKQSARRRTGVALDAD